MSNIPTKAPAEPQPSRRPVSQCKGKPQESAAGRNHPPNAIVSSDATACRRRQSLLENSLRKTNDGKDPPPTPSLPGERCFGGSQASLGQGDWIPPLAEPTHSPSGIISTPYEQAVPSKSSRALTMMSSFIAQDGHSSCTETLLSTPSVPGPPCVLNAEAQPSETETLSRGTHDGVDRDNCNIVGPQQRYFALCALVLSSVKWAQS